MPHIYIANATKQNHLFYARIPERPTALQHLIPIGRQIRFPAGNEGLPQKIMDGIIEHHGNYGMVHASKIEDVRNFTGLIWSEKPIEAPQIMRIVEINNDILEDIGQTSREEAAIAAAVNATQEANYIGAPVDIRDLDQTIEIRQEPTRENPRPQANQQVQVTSDPDKLQQAENMGHTIITPRGGGQRDRTGPKRRGVG